MIIGAVHLHPSQNRHHRLAAIGHESCLVAFRAEHASSLIASLVHVQQALHQMAPHLMHAPSHRHLQCFQIQTSPGLPFVQGLADQTLYFLARLFLDSL